MPRPPRRPRLPEKKLVLETLTSAPAAAAIPQKPRTACYVSVTAGRIPRRKCCQLLFRTRAHTSVRQTLRRFYGRHGLRRGGKSIPPVRAGRSNVHRFNRLHVEEIVSFSKFYLKLQGMHGFGNNFWYPFTRRNHNLVISVLNLETSVIPRTQ